MTELLILVLVVAAYLLGKARDERDRLLRALAERRSGARRERDHWQPHEQQLAAEQELWRQTAVLHQAARRAMHSVVADATTERPTSATRPAAPPRRTRASVPAMRSSELSAEEIQCLARRAMR